MTQVLLKVTNANVINYSRIKLKAAKKSMNQ